MGYLVYRWAIVQPYTWGLIVLNTPIQPVVSAHAAQVKPCALPSDGVCASSGGIITPLEILGSPASVRYPECIQAYARNPWALDMYQGRLYIGLGDLSNEGPSPNAGPVPVITYDPGSGKFTQENTLDEEELAHFYPRGDELWIPGTGPAL
ncbi:MAG: hypothetical protein ACKOET_04345, partial [Verrucomicrobiota bacterium]